eukprot:g8606.t1
MSSSLAGGLLPLGNRAGSGSAGSQSNLTGGLIPLTTTAKPTARLRDEKEPLDGGGGGSGGWDQQEKGWERGEEGVSGRSRSDKKSKMFPSSRRRGAKEKRGGRRESSPSSSRGRQGSKGSRDTGDDNPTIDGLGGGGSGNKEGWKRSNAYAARDVNVNVDVEPEDEDDSYLFMGATAGAKGKKSSGGGTAEEALDYDSTDSFGLPKPKPKAGKQNLDPTPAQGGSGSTRTGQSATSEKGEHDRLSSPRPPTSVTTDWLSRDSATSSSFLGGRPDPTPGAAAATEAAVVPTPEPQVDLDEDFDFPDDDLNDLLEMTDPSVLAKASTSATAPPSDLASVAMPPLSPLGVPTDPLRDDRKKQGEQASDAVPSPSPAGAGATNDRSVTLGESEGKEAGRRSPSPPSSPREDHSNRHSLRSRPGRGLTYSGSRDSLKGRGGGMSDESGESGLRGHSGRNSERSSQGAVEPAASNTVVEGVLRAAGSPTGSSMRSSISRAGSHGERGEILPEEGETGRSARDSRAFEPNPQAHDSDLEKAASALSGQVHEEATSSLQETGEGDGSDPRRLLAFSGPGIAPTVGARAPRRSALAGADTSKSQSRQPKSRGVTFDDDLAGLDALDILPGSSSDEGEKRGGGDPPPTKGAELPSTISPPDHGRLQDSAKTDSIVNNKSPVEAAEPSVDPLVGGGSGNDVLLPRATAPSSGMKVSRRSSAAMTEGLSPAAARLVAEDSSSEESQVPQANEASAMGSLLGLGEPRPRSIARGDPQDGTSGTGAASLLGQELKDEGEGEDLTTTDDAKLDLALGFTPSSMDGGRKPRRTLPAGRRRRPRGGGSPTTGDMERMKADFSSLASTPSKPVSLPEKSTEGRNIAISSLGDTARGEAVAAGAAATAVAGVDAAKGMAETGNGPLGRASEVPSTPTAPVAAASPVETTPSTDAAAIAIGDCSQSSSALSTGASSSAALPEVSNSSPLAADTISHDGGTPSSSTVGPRHGIGGRTTAIAKSSGAEDTGESRGVDASVLASLERQLVVLVGEKEAIAARSARDEQRMQKDSDLAREAVAAAQARAFDSEAALVVARARISQLEAEAAGHASHLAAVESRAASGLKAEQEACLTRISNAETRHQEGLRKAESRHSEALVELKRLHREELEDIKRRNSDSKTLEALAGQVQASAGAIKLLQSDMMQRKNVSEVSREGQMEVRERLIKELEQSARRAQQTAEEEVQRLQGTLMAMDQVMSALRGQNAGERERLRQEHLRMEALQGSMVAEVSAVRESVDEERQRLSERCAALDREKKQVDLEARVERDRLAEQRRKLEADRERFAALQVSASKASEEMARRHAGEAESLNLARQSLEREVSAFEARLNSARAELQKADHVRDSLDRLREQDELERRRLKALSGELERAFEEVRTRSEDSEELRREAEAIKTEALAASKAASQEREAAQLQSARVEEVARRLETERTSIAQARARSATELSTSRRLKAELARAFAAQQRQQARGVGTAADMVLSSRTSPLYGQHSAGGGGDTGAGLAIGVNGRGSGGGASVSAMMMMPGVPPGAISGQPASGLGLESTSHPLPPDNGAGGVGVGIPFTGVAAAEATLQAISSAPPYPGMDVGRELGRLARRAADLRECTKAQSAFLSSSRAARFSSAAHKIPEELTTTMAWTGLETPEFRLASPPEFISSASEAAGNGVGIGVEVRPERQERVCDGTQGFDLGAVHVGLSSTVMEELDNIERACSQRCSALKEEEEPFVDTLGKDRESVGA